MRRFPLLLLGLLLLPAVAGAQDLPSFSFFTPAGDDYSLKYLGDIFGSMGDFLAGQPTILSAVFKYFNSAVLVLGAIVGIYTLAVGTMNTAHDGEALGRRWSSQWVPMRAAVGFSLLLPLKSGYCLIQVIMMWIVVQGIGAADAVWDQALQYLKEGGQTYSSQSDNQYITQYTENMQYPLQYMICAYEIGLQNQANISSFELYSSYLPTDGTTAYYEFPGKVLNKAGQPLVSPGTCGKISWTPGLNAATQTYASDQANGWLSVIQMLSTSASSIAYFQNYQQSASSQPPPPISGMKVPIFMNVYTIPILFSELASQLVVAGATWSSFIMPLAEAQAAQANQQVLNFVSIAELKGWITAGQYYYSLVQASSQANAETQINTVFSPSSMNAAPTQGAGNLPKNVWVRMYNAAASAASSAAAQASGGSTPGSGGADFQGAWSPPSNLWLKYLLQALTMGLFSALDDFNNIFLAGGTTNIISPMLKVSTFGADLVSKVTRAWEIGAGVVTGIGLAAGIMSCTAVAFTALVSWVVPIYSAIFLILLTVGLTLAYYLPMVPYILFLFASIGWFIAVIETMVAAPIVALGLAHPEGQHEVFGKAGPAVMLILSVFLRPSLMIIGLLSAMIISFVSLSLLNVGYGPVYAKISEMRGGTGTFTHVFSPIAAIIIYMVIVVTIAQKSFSLITIVPDKVLRWLEGGHMASGFGEEGAQMAAQVEQKASGGLGSMGRIAGTAGGQGIQAATKMSTAASGKVASAIKSKMSGSTKIETPDGDGNGNGNGNGDGDGGGGAGGAGMVGGGGAGLGGGAGGAAAAAAI